MKKRTTAAKSGFQKNIKDGKFEKPGISHFASKQMSIVKDFSFAEFKKIAAQVDLTQKEWADILHISERTLQRYAKDNSTFNFGVIDRILLIDRVIKKGVEVFGNAPDFITWLKDEPISVEGRLGLHSLASFDGVTKVLNQLGRIEHGILA